MYHQTENDSYETFDISKEEMKRWLHTEGSAWQEMAFGDEVANGSLSDYVDNLPDTEIDGKVEEMAGWYWQSGFPGCIPDSDPFGPFETEDLAIANHDEE